MNMASLVLGTLIAFGLALIFHVLRGGKMARLILHLFSAWISFFMGHGIAQMLGWHWLRSGSLNLLPAVMASIFGLLLASFFAGPSESRHGNRPEVSKSKDPFNRFQ